LLELIYLLYRPKPFTPWVGKHFLRRGTLKIYCQLGPHIITHFTAIIALKTLTKTFTLSSTR